MTNSKYCPNDVKRDLPSDLSKEELESFPAYKTWFAALQKTLEAQSSPEHPYHQNPYKLRSIDIQSVDRFGKGRLGFIKLKADVSADDGQKFPGSVFMRGGSVAMLLVLTAESKNVSSGKGDPEANEYVILTVQPRIPAGTLTFTEIPAGMIDDSGTFSGAAASEIEEETGLKIQEEELINLTELALGSNNEDGEVLQNAIYPSPGGCDEFIPIFFARKTMQLEEIEKLQGKLTGLRETGEKITLKIVKLRDAWKVAGRDVKTLSAICLYDGLRQEGKI